MVNRWRGVLYGTVMVVSWVASPCTSASEIVSTNVIMQGTRSIPTASGTNDTLAYQVNQTPTLGISSPSPYYYQFSINGGVSGISQIEIPLFSPTAISSVNLGSTGGSYTILPNVLAQPSGVSYNQQTAYWGYSSGTSVNGKSAFNSSNVPYVLLFSGLSSTATSLTLGFYSSSAPVNGVYGFLSDAGPSYIDPPTPGPNNVPEPSPLLLLVAGVMGIGLSVRKFV